MERNKILLLDMYGVIIQESKGYFVPYTLQRFDTSEHTRIIKAIREEKCFTRAQLGELSNEQFLRYLGYQNPQEVMEDYLKNYLNLDEEFINFAKRYDKTYDFCLLSNDVLEWSDFLTDYHKLNSYFRDKFVSGAIGMRKPDKEIFYMLFSS